MAKHTDSVCVFYYLLVQLIFVLRRVEGNMRNKLHLVLQRSLVRDKLQENIARFT